MVGGGCRGRGGGGGEERGGGVGGREVGGVLWVLVRELGLAGEVKGEYRYWGGEVGGGEGGGGGVRARGGVEGVVGGERSTGVWGGGIVWEGRMLRGKGR